MASPSIVTIYPAADAASVPISAQITVLFDREIDESRITAGTFVITGPDDVYLWGPNLAVDFDNPASGEDDDILDSPGYLGFVQGAFTFQRIEAAGDSVSVAYDYSGTGTIYRSKAIFTPAYPLAANTEYTVYIAGDDDALDDRKAGVTTRTVFDVEKGLVSGSGIVSARGGYTGTIADRFVVTVTTGGASGTAVVQWYKESDPLLVYNLSTSQGYQSLGDGVEIAFDSGTFIADDVYYITVKAPEIMSSTYTWTFTSGSGAIEAVPSSASSSVVATATAATDFAVSSVSPESRESNIDLNKCRIITVNFSADLDESTITDSIVKIYGLPANGIDDGTISYKGELVKKLEISGSQLKIYI